ncbi:MAG: cation:proton antiporter [Gemmatimonadaceae bacterium]
MHIETTLVILFSIATAAAIAARWLKIPYTVALVVAGIVLGATHLIDPPHLTHDLVFATILPGLLFEAAFNMDAAVFLRNKVAISALAIPGVIVAIVIAGSGTAVAIWGLAPSAGFTLRQGLVFGALVAATDPIAVVALFKELRVPVRLATLVEGESLVNDGTSIVFFSLLLAVVAGTATSTGQLVLQFVIIVGGGAFLGFAAGHLASMLIARIDDAVIEITITVITAYGTFAMAEQLGVSGVIATVVAAMYCGTRGWSAGMSRKTKYALTSFWDYLAFALNSVVFLLIGFEVSGLDLLNAWSEIVVAFVVVLIARAAVVFGVGTLLRRSRQAIPTGWLSVMTWGGLRGALSMVLALSLPFDFPNRARLITLTFGVVVLSIVLQGLTMERLLRRIGVVKPEPDETVEA